MDRISLIIPHLYLQSLIEISLTPMDEHVQTLGGSANARELTEILAFVRVYSRLYWGEIAGRSEYLYLDGPRSIPGMVDCRREA